MMKTTFKIVLICLLFFSTSNLTSFIQTVKAANEPSRMLGKLDMFGDGHSERDHFNSVTVTGDDHVAVGYSDSTEGELLGLNKGYEDAIIVKYGPNGNIKWTKTFGGSSGDAFNAVTTAGDSTVAVGYAASNDGDLTLKEGYINAIIVKYDRDGNVEWKNELGSVNSKNSFNSVTATSDGFITAGYLNGDAVIVKYDNNGNQIWLKKFGGSESDMFHSVITTSDGYIAVGETSSEDGDVTGLTEGFPTGFIVKYDVEGNVIWKKAYGGRLFSSYNSIITTDDGVIIAGKASSDALIIKYDVNGNVVWKKTFGGSGSDGFNAVTPTSDGFLAAGGAFSNDGDLDHLNTDGEDALLVQYDRDGNVVWKKTIGGSVYDEFNGVTTNEHGILAVGSAASDDYAIILDLRPLNQIQQLTVDYGTDFKLVTVNPADASETFHWTSSNQSIVYSYYNGGVSVIGPGSAVLEGVSTKNNEEKLTIPIVVNDYVKVTLPEDPLYLTIGTTGKLTAEVTPIDASNQTIHWSSSNPSVATVDSNGNVTAIQRGKVAVTATSEVGEYKARVLVIVSLPYHKVSFNSNGGSFVSDRYYEEGSLFDRLDIPQPTKTGYVFGGWYKDENLTKPWYESSDRVESDTTLYAKWNIRSYRVDFNSTGGSLVSPTTAYENTTITAPTPPRRTGYTFAGWYKLNGTTPWVFSSDKITANTILYAKWTLNRYTVSFNSTGGSQVNSMTTNYNTIINAPTAPKRTGYTFSGWFKDSSGKTPWIFTSDKVTVNTTLYAKWTVNQYTVNFNSNGGSKVSAKTTDYNTTITAPTAPKRTGYTFGGWYKEASLKTPWNFSSNKVTTNTTLYAKWTVTPPPTPKSIVVTKSSSTSLKIVWSQVTGTSGYELYRATKSSGSYTLIKSTTSVQVTNSNLKRGSTYYYKVRAYKLVGTKKVYSGWSVIRSAKL
ncbi:InlB B-repeat-containing protein [Bacillus sp. AFS029533]|uniref:InlB B-repeat-containing protein n=1 Tax=Bacillus sp. AFS029533 TaxID=2033494 RepID=UPI000BFCE1DD|nr:InlB B-repeat-containing protein [Bacillus sp. AFS029533]PGZ89007.1 hypothetical protein COE53_19285 [Bacillus sp. AFS029533]